MSIVHDSEFIEGLKKTVKEVGCLQPCVERRERLVS